RLSLRARRAAHRGAERGAADVRHPADQRSLDPRPRRARVGHRFLLLARGAHRESRVLPVDALRPDVRLRLLLRASGPPAGPAAARFVRAGGYRRSDLVLDTVGLASTSL